MKIAIFGGTGLLGSNLVKKYIDAKLEVRAFSRSYCQNIQDKYNQIINFDNLEDELDCIFKIWKPDLIINCIALVDLNKCEQDYKLAENANVLIPKRLVVIAKKYQSYYIHISTDHYFNDSKLKHTENDNVVLLNNYAKSKYKAEKEVLDVSSSALVVRTNIIGFRNTDKDSFWEWLLYSLKSKFKIGLLSNFYTSPIAVSNLADILLKCYYNKLKGVYNIASSEVIDKFSFGIKVADKFNYSLENVSKVTKIENNTNVTRALSLGLEVEKIESDLGVKMPTVDEAINCLYDEYKKGLK